MFADHPVRKEAQLDWKNKDFTKLPYGDFFKGVTRDFGQKLEFFSLVAFNKICFKIMFPDHPVWKLA